MEFEEDYLRNAVLLFCENRGIYIPRAFALMFNENREFVEGVTDWVFDTLLSGPEHDDYWEAWERVLNNAVLNGEDQGGKRYRVYQDGDLWLVPEEDDEVAL